MVASQSADEVPDFDDLFGVQSDGRLVENDDRRISHQRAGDAHALTVALGQVAYDAPADIADMHDLAYLGKVRLAGQSASLDVVIEAEVLVHGHVEIQGRLFRQVSDQSFGAQRVSQHVNSPHDDASGRAGQASCQDIHGRGFAGTVGSQQSDHLARSDLQRHVIHGAQSPVILYQMFKLYHRGFSFPAGAVSRALFPHRRRVAGMVCRREGKIMHPVVYHNNVTIV